MSIQMEDSPSIIFFKKPKKNLEELSHLSLKAQRGQTYYEIRKATRRKISLGSIYLICWKPLSQGSTRESEPAGEICIKIHCRARLTWLWGLVKQVRDS